MADTTQSAGSVAAQPGELNPIAAANTLPGTVLYHAGGEAAAARANNATTARAVCVAMGAGAAGKNVRAAFSKAIELTTEQWDAVTGGTGGLTEGAQYYLSTATPGHHQTSIATNPNYVVPTGRALSSTVMLVQVGLAVLGLGG